MAQKPYLNRHPLSLRNLLPLHLAHGLIGFGLRRAGIGLHRLILVRSSPVRLMDLVGGERSRLRHEWLHQDWGIL